ncbi:3-carboxy-cis,cis-muconate cycloisomerase [Rhodoglobus aureus]|uniref:3-carboxy-cis,cis-muconate cycloisomerase n=1 Tax=Rhodoglobus aureus TaxID=191497 RepID=A0ABN1VKA5_9MICO
MLCAILDVEVGLATAQNRLGLVPDAAAEAIRNAAARLELDAARLALASRSSGGNPIIPLLADLRSAVGPDASNYVHLGATSQDILDSALMLVSKRSISLLVSDLDSALTTLAALADRHRTTAIAGRTLTQHSVPTTFGLKAAGWMVGVADARRFLVTIADNLPAQLGGAAGTLASFTQLLPGRELALVDAFADELGLEPSPLPWHTIRTPVIRLADALAGVGVALGKIGVDVSLLSRTEIAELSEESGGGSSTMPQKQNPILSVLLQAAARNTPEIAAELHRSAIAVDERPDGAWHTEWQAQRDLLRTTGGAASLAAELLTGLRVDTDRMRQNLGLTGPLIVSERVMLVAGPILGKNKVRQLIAVAASEPASLRKALTRELPDWSDAQLNDLLNPESYLGISDELIDRAMAHVKASG